MSASRLSAVWISRLVLSLGIVASTWSATVLAQGAPPVGSGSPREPNPPRPLPPPTPLAPAYPPPPAPPGSLPTALPPPPSVPGPNAGPGWGGAQASGSAGVYVELQADDPNARIDRVFEGTTVPVCLAPCRRVLDRNNLYVIGGDGVRSTSQFLLPDDRDRVTLNVKVGSSSRLATGAAVMLAGGVVGYVGLFLWELSVTARLAERNGTTPGPRGNAGLGLGMMGVGLAAVGIGAYLAFTTRTTVTSSTGASFSGAPPLRRRRSFFALTPRGIEF